MEKTTIPYMDAHCDTVYRCAETGGSLRQNTLHVDLLRGRQFGRYAQFFALFFDGADTQARRGRSMWEICRQYHAYFLGEIARSGDLVAHCRTGAEVDAAAAAGKVAALLSIEGAELLECDPARVEIAADWGVRLLNPVWNRANALSGTNCEEPDRGLTAAGRAFIRRMEAHGVYADVSHLSDAGFWDLYDMAEKPIVASHSNARALCAHPRNLTDDMFRAIRDSGGFVGINLYGGFLGEKATFETLAAHLEHFLALDGEKTVALGGDLDGCDILPAGMRDMSGIVQLWQTLEDRGYGDGLLEDLFWNNMRRLL